MARCRPTRSSACFIVELCAPRDNAAAHRTRPKPSTKASGTGPAPGPFQPLRRWLQVGGRWCKVAPGRCLLASLLIPLYAAAQLASTDAARGDSPALEGRDWQIDAYRTANGLKPAVLGTGHGYVRFDTGRFRINAGCSTLNGSYWLDGDRLIFSPHIGSLLRDCPETLMAQEQAILGLLGAVERFGALSGRMALTDASGITLLSLIHPAAVPLTERVWRLMAYRNAQEAVVPALPAPVFSLEFNGAGNLSGQACDTYRAVFTREDQQIKLVGPIATSRQGCTGSEQASRQGIDYLAALAKVDRYQIAGNTLLLRDADGRMLASFKEIDDAAASTEEASKRDNLPAAPEPLLPGLR